MVKCKINNKYFQMSDFFMSNQTTEQLCFPVEVEKFIHPQSPLVRRRFPFEAEVSGGTEE